MSAIKYNSSSIQQPDLLFERVFFRGNRNLVGTATQWCRFVLMKVSQTSPEEMLRSLQRGRSRDVTHCLYEKETIFLCEVWLWTGDLFYIFLRIQLRIFGILSCHKGWQKPFDFTLILWCLLAWFSFIQLLLLSSFFSPSSPVWVNVLFLTLGETFRDKTGRIKFRAGLKFR